MDGHPSRYWKVVGELARMVRPTFSDDRSGVDFGVGGSGTAEHWSAEFSGFQLADGIEALVPALEALAGEFGAVCLEDLADAVRREIEVFGESVFGREVGFHAAWIQVAILGGHGVMVGSVFGIINDGMAGYRLGARIIVIPIDAEFDLFAAGLHPVDFAAFGAEKERRSQHLESMRSTSTG